ncbi:hypothetical protein AnigIFM63309_000057 [Aspergillus niger]|nr:hypothetical protein AnigIFM63309_000057 [Aspergillus niger]
MAGPNSVRLIDNMLASVILEVQSLLRRLLEIDMSHASSSIVRHLDAEGIKTTESMATPGEPQELPTAIDEAIHIFQHSMQLNHPSSFAYIPACPSPLAWLGDLLTSFFNANTAIWDLSSGPSTIEQGLIRWLASEIGMPSTAGGCFVSGGSMANLACIVAARDKMLPPCRRADGVIYISDQTHLSVAKSLRIAGFFNDQIRVVPSDSKLRMDVASLREAILRDRQQGCIPFLVVGSCGTTNTGSIDPLNDLADIAQSENLWFHVDGAYAATIALSVTHRGLVYGLGRADSLTWDAHKWLFQTFGSGMVFVRRARDLENSFAVEGEYIRSFAPKETTNFYNMSPELSRPARAMSLWLTMRVLGRQRISDMIDHGILLARSAEDELRRYPMWQIVSPATAGILVFRYMQVDLGEDELDVLNLKISARLLTENVAAILTTKIHGRVVLRMCTMNPNVQPETVIEIMRKLNTLAEDEMTQKITKDEAQPMPQVASR